LSQSIFRPRWLIKHPNREHPLFEDNDEYEEEYETDVTQLSMNFRFSWIIMVSTIMPKPVAIFG
jgi:hypothetical protein